MTEGAPPAIDPPSPPRPSRWPYWVVVPVGALVYTAFCLAFALEAWGGRGELQPWWFGVAGVLAIPGLWCPPSIGAPFWGGLLGFGIIRWFRRIRGRGFRSA